MPIYEYKCNKCGHIYEALQSIDSDSDDLQCPKCGAKEATKLFSTFASGEGARSTSSAGCIPRSGFS